MLVAHPPCPTHKIPPVGTTISRMHLGLVKPAGDATAINTFSHRARYISSTNIHCCCAGLNNSDSAKAVVTSTAMIVNGTS